MRDRFHWARLLSLVTGLVNEELLLSQRVPGGRESRPPSSCAGPPPLVGCGAIHLGRDRQTTRPPSSAGYRSRGQAGNPACLVSAVGGAEVRRLPPSCVSRPPQDIAGRRGSGGPVGTGEPGLGI